MENQTSNKSNDKKSTFIQAYISQMLNQQHQSIEEVAKLFNAVQ